MQFEWDSSKAQSNLNKHGIDFADAASVFNDDLALNMRDAQPDEDRFVILGADSLGRLLTVVYVLRGNAVRIISARKATPRERTQYEG